MVPTHTTTASDERVAHQEPLDVETIRRDFPILSRRVGGHPLSYLDNAASAQRPRVVLEAMDRLYEESYSNIHRGVHALSQESTTAYEAARKKLARFLGVADEREVVFVRGTTEGINLVAESWGRQALGAGDEVVITELEHHSNIVPWQRICEATGARLVPAPIEASGDLDLEALERLLGERTKLLAVTHVSNVLGTVVDIPRVAAMAKKHGALVLVDGAQAVPHMKVDIDELGVDFYTFSGHKAFGPSGIGVLWGRRELLDAMPPYQSGGGMIEMVTFERTTYVEAPARFEAGTPNIVGAIGLAAACDYLDDLGMERVVAYEQVLLEAALQALDDVPGVKLSARPRHQASVVSFTMEGIHPHDLGTILDGEGVAVRVGHHCAQPLMSRLGVPATARASFAFYNTVAEIGRLVDGLKHARTLFGV